MISCSERGIWARALAAGANWRRVRDSSWEWSDGVQIPGSRLSALLAVRVLITESRRHLGNGEDSSQQEARLSNSLDCALLLLRLDLDQGGGGETASKAFSVML